MPPKRTSLLPPLVTHDSVLDRTIQNIKQASGCTTSTWITVSELRRSDDQGGGDGVYTLSPPTSSGANIIISVSVGQSKSPSRDVLPADMSDVVPETSQQGIPPPPAADTAERLKQVEADRRRLVDDLNSSTAMATNLRLRCEIHEADLARCNAALQSCQADADTRIKQALKDKATWLITSCASMGMSAVYVGWCWLHSVEMEYIRTRRREHLGL